MDHYRAPCDGGRYGGASWNRGAFWQQYDAPQIGKFLDRYGVKKGLVLESVTIGAIFLYAAWAVHGITSGVFTGRVEQIFAFTAYIFIMIADHLTRFM